MRTLLIVNADDLGLHPSLDEGIFTARREGVLTSASLLVTGRTARFAARQARREGLAVGVHLSLCGNLPTVLPASKVKSLAPLGILPPAWSDFVRAWALGRVDGAEVQAELEAQLCRAQEYGLEVDHVDSHQHLHLLPGLQAHVLGLAKRHGLPVRWPSWDVSRRWLRKPVVAMKTTLLCALAAMSTHPLPRAPQVRMVGLFESGALDEVTLLQLLARLPAGLVELGCHPGLTASAIPEAPAWRYRWEAELHALSSHAVRRALTESSIELTTHSAAAVQTRPAARA